MTTTAPVLAPGRAPVAAPPLSPPTVSLLTAANVTDLKDRELTGVTYVGEGVGIAQVIGLSGATKTPVTGCDTVLWYPFAVLGSFKTGNFNLKTTDVRARATRNLIAHESHLIEAQLWGSTSATAIDDAQPTIVSGANVFTSAVALTKAIATMEQELATLGHSGAPMMFHMRPYLFNMLLEATSSSSLQIRREGNRYYTAMDNILVPGRGYDGKGPAGQAVGSTEWMYATAPVDIRRGDIFYPGEGSSTVDRVQNNTTYFAERAVVASFDTSALKLALEVTT